jgi:hypothetical protein
MAVVIDEFEVAVHEPSQPSSATASGSAPSVGAPKPEEIVRAIERQVERYARVRAH